MDKFLVKDNRLEPSDCFSVSQNNIGLTDLVHTESGNDSEISDSSNDVDGFIKKMENYQPKYIAFNVKKVAFFVLGYRGETSLVDFGIQENKIGESILFVLPSNLGSVRRYWDEKYSSISSFVLLEYIVRLQSKGSLNSEGFKNFKEELSRISFKDLISVNL